MDEYSMLTEEIDPLFQRKVIWKTRRPVPPKPDIGTLGKVTYEGFSYQCRYRISTFEARSSRAVLEFLEEFGSEIDWTPEQMLEEYVPPTLEDLRFHVAGYDRPELRPSSLTSTLVDSAVLAIARAEGSNRVIDRWLEPENLSRVRVPSKTSPGLRYRRAGFKTKKDALLTAIKDAYVDLARMTSEGVQPEEIPCSMAGRGKLVGGEGVASGKAAGRLIIVPDLARHLIGCLGAQPCARFVRNLSKENGGVMVGLGIFNNSWARFFRLLEGPYTYYCLDFSGFDQSLPAWVIKKAFSVIRKKFRAAPGDDEYWDHEYNRLCHTLIADPSGHLFRKHCGVGSGDPWTSLIGSYANWIILMSACIKLGVEGPKIFTFGDDSVMALPRGGKTPSIDQFQQVITEMFGMTIHPRKSFVTTQLYADKDRPVEDQKPVTFLSYACNSAGLPVRSHRDVTSILLHPEWNEKDDPVYELSRVWSLYLSTYWNDKSEKFLRTLFFWLRARRTGKGRHAWDDVRWLTKHGLPYSVLLQATFDDLPDELDIIRLYSINRHDPLSKEWTEWVTEKDVGSLRVLPMSS